MSQWPCRQRQEAAALYVKDACRRRVLCSQLPVWGCRLAAHHTTNSGIWAMEHWPRRSRLSATMRQQPFLCVSTWQWVYVHVCVCV